MGNVTPIAQEAAPALDLGPMSGGLTSAEAADRLATYGPNVIEERAVPAWRRLAARFWGPLPWMLEVTIVLTFALGKDLEGAIITLLLVTNALIGFRQSSKADRALRALRSRLAVAARVRRDGAWTVVPAREVVPGDLVCVRAGDIAPADLDVLDGSASVDHSALTGESLPEDVGPGGRILSSGTIARGMAGGRVTATGAESYFGRTARLVQSARPATALERAIFAIIKNLVIIDTILVGAMVIYALVVHAPLSDIAPFALIVLIASVPVALPSTFSMSQAIGAQTLSHRNGVLVSRLQAIQEAASMDVLCTDKTGTITLNKLALAGVTSYPPFREDEVRLYAALASEAAEQDPIDVAILAAAPGDSAGWQRLEYQPFDPATKRAEAVLMAPGPAGPAGAAGLAGLAGRRVKAVKGMPEVVAALCVDPPRSLAEDVEAHAAQGARVLAVAIGDPATPLRLAGLVALADPPRPDAAHLVAELRGLGIEVKMVTGDTAATARAVARAVGIEGPLVTGAEIRANPSLVRTAAVVAAVYPEDKFDIVRTLQHAGHTVGMTGDGVNDAPALRQAEVGIAVQGAVDVARAAASMVLTDPGLVDVVRAVEVSRSIHQRMLTWVVNKIVKTAQVSLFLTLGFFLTRRFVTTPLDIVLLLFTNDFVTMSLAVDNARPSPRPDRWAPAAVTWAALVVAVGVVAQSFLDLWLARGPFHVTWAQTQTLMFVMLVFTGQATVYLVRERDRLWRSRPSPILALATGVDLVVVAAAARIGILVTPVPLPAILAVLGIAVGCTLALDPVKVWVFRRVGLR